MENASISEIQRRLQDRFNNKPADALKTIEGNSDITFALSDEWEIGGVKLRAPSIGVIMLLQAVNSPFLDDDKNRMSGLKDIMEALFILKYRELLAPMIFKSNEQKALLSRAEKIAEKSPEFFDCYLRHIEGVGNAEYEILLAAFTDALGTIDLPGVTSQLIDYIGRSVAAFQMLPDSGKGSKKK